VHDEESLSQTVWECKKRVAWIKKVGQVLKKTTGFWKIFAKTPLSFE
jgi:hypothetical protein